MPSENVNSKKRFIMQDLIWIVIHVKARGPKGVWTLQKAGLPIPKASVTFAAAKPSLTHQVAPFMEERYCYLRYGCVSLVLLSCPQLWRLGSKRSRSQGQGFFGNITAHYFAFPCPWWPQLKSMLYRSEQHELLWTTAGASISQSSPGEENWFVTLVWCIHQVLAIHAGPSRSCKHRKADIHSEPERGLPPFEVGDPPHTNCWTARQLLCGALFQVSPWVHQRLRSGDCMSPLSLKHCSQQAIQLCFNYADNPCCCISFPFERERERSQRWTLLWQRECIISSLLWNWIAFRDEDGHWNSPVLKVGFKATGRECLQSHCGGILRDHVLDW